MSDDTPYTQAELNAVVERIIAAVAVDGTAKAAITLDALAFVAAMIYDLDPTVKAPSHLRKAAEAHGSIVWTFLKYLRKHFDQTGVHFGEAIGGTVGVDPKLLEELTKGMTKQ